MTMIYSSAVRRLWSFRLRTKPRGRGGGEVSHWQQDMIDAYYGALTNTIRSCGGPPGAETLCPDWNLWTVPLMHPMLSTSGILSLLGPDFATPAKSLIKI